MQSKLKILKVLDILSETDKTHPITAPAICEELAKCGIEAERKSVCRDINTLIEYGYKIIRCHDNKLGYYMEKTNIKKSEPTTPEVPVTLDSVHIKLEYKKNDAATVRDILGKGKETEDEGYIIAEYSFPSSSLYATLLTLGTVAKLIEPEEIKADFEKRLNDVSEYYKKRRDNARIDVWLL